MGVHVLDAAWWLMGMPRPTGVSGVAGAHFGPKGEGYWNFQRPDESYWRKYNSDDYAGGIIRFENGAGLQVESFWASHMPGGVQVELFGTDGGGTMRPIQLYSTEYGAPKDERVEIPKSWPISWDNVAGHYVDCILDGVTCLSPLRHGLYVQAMLEAVLESGRVGREVVMDEFFEGEWRTPEAPRCDLDDEE